MKDPLLILIVILVVVIIWRGPKTLPQIGHMLGRGVKEARKEAAEIKTEIRKDDPATPAPVASPAPVATVIAAPPVAPLPVVAPPPAEPGSPGPGPA